MPVLFDPDDPHESSSRATPTQVRPIRIRNKLSRIGRNLRGTFLQFGQIAPNCVDLLLSSASYKARGWAVQELRPGRFRHLEALVDLCVVSRYLVAGVNFGPAPTK